MKYEPDSTLAEAHQKFGRNILLFQQIERLMKLLVAAGEIETTPHGLTAATIKSHSRIKSRTFGQLIKPLMRYFKNGEAHQEKIVEPTRFITIKTSFRIEMTKDEMHKFQTKIEKATHERNELAHHFLDRFNLASVGCAMRTRALRMTRCHAP